MAAEHPEDRLNSDPAPVKGALPADRLRNLGMATRQSSYKPSYSRRVRRLRVILPALAVVALAIVLLWSRIQAEFNHPSQTSAEERQARMVNGRYVGSDSHGRPYTVTYDSAQQPPGGGPIEMINPTAELTLQNGHWVAVKADKGRYDQAASLIDLSGNVQLFHDEGYRFATERAHVEFGKNLLWGDRAITGQGPKGEVAARGFRVLDNGDAFVFTGPTRLTLRPDAAQMDEPGEKP